MWSAEKYREFAKEYLDWARTAKSPSERELFLQMAQTCLQAATAAQLLVRSPELCDVVGKDPQCE